MKYFVIERGKVFNMFDEDLTQKRASIRFQKKN